MATAVEGSTQGGGGGVAPGKLAGAGRSVYVAPQWKLVWWKFVRHRLAVASAVLLGLFYLTALFSEVMAPYDPRQFDTSSQLAPPHLPRFVDAEGRFHLQPFVYARRVVVDRTTFQREYPEDTTTRYPLALLVRGDPYELWGLITSDLHLFGVRSPEVRLYLLGTDGLGRDLLSRIIEGARISLSVGLLGIAISFALGIVIGGISGYFGGRVDMAIQRIIEFIRSVPTLPLWMALSASLPTYWTIIQVYFGIVVILSLVGWTGLARVVRGKLMSLRDEDYVMSARLNGASEPRIIFLYLLPSFTSHIIAALTLSIPGMILGETALSFIGLGLQAPAISWGVLLKESQAIRVIASAPWLLLPGVAVVIVILAFNFVGDGLRDAADPYSAV